MHQKVDKSGLSNKEFKTPTLLEQHKSLQLYAQVSVANTDRV